MLKPVLLACATLAAALAAPLSAAGPYAVAGEVPLSGDTGWDYSVVDAAAHRLYQSRGVRVDVLDTRTEKTVGSIPDAHGVHGIAIADDLGRGFVSDGLSGTVQVFDLKSLKVLQVLRAGRNPDCVLYDPFTRRVFAFNGGSRDASVWDARTGAALATLPLDCKPEFAVSDGAGRVFVNREDKDGIAVIDARTLKVAHIWPLKGHSPSGLALDRANHRLFAVCDGGKMEVLDSRRGATLAEVPIGLKPDAAAFDPGTGLAFSSNGEGSLTVVDTASPGFPVLQTLATRPNARTMALDPSTHALYLVFARFLPPPAGGATQGRRRRSIVPGSVGLLVAKYR